MMHHGPSGTLVRVICPTHEITTPGRSMIARGTLLLVVRAGDGPFDGYHDVILDGRLVTAYLGSTDTVVERVACK